jgi:hypothetical protein
MTNAATGAFSGTLPARAGSTVCAKAVNLGLGADTVVGCKAYTVTLNPYGALDLVSVTPTGLLTVSGWAVDPDTADPISVTIQRDDAATPGTEYVTTVTASNDRSDIAPAHFPGYGSLHGYFVTIPAGLGLQTVCVSAINTGPGTNTALNCLQVTTHRPGRPSLSVGASGKPKVVTVDLYSPDRALTYTLERQATSYTPPYTRGPWSVVRATTVSSDHSYWVDSDVVPGNGYCYRAVVTNAYGTSDVSQTECADVLLPPLPRPTDLWVSDVTATQATLHWTDNATTESSYRLKVDGLVATSMPAHPGTGAMSHQVTGLQSGVTQCFWVSARRLGYEDATVGFCFTTPLP